MKTHIFNTNTIYPEYMVRVLNCSHFRVPNIYTNDVYDIYKECDRMAQIGVKAIKNSHRALVIAGFLGIAYAVSQFNEKKDATKLDLFNNVLTAPVQSSWKVFASEKSCVIGNEDSSDNSNYEYKYTCKASLTAFINRTDELYIATLYWCALPLIDAINTDDLLSQYKDHICVGLKGSKPAGYILRNLDSKVFAGYGCGGDNDMDVIIDPSLDPVIFDSLRRRLSTIVRKIVIQSIESIYNVYAAINPQKFTLPDDNPLNIVYNLRCKQSYQLNRFTDSVTVKNYLTGEKLPLVFYANKYIMIRQYDEKVCEFALYRLMAYYEAIIPYTNIKVTHRAEILDISICSQTDQTLPERYMKCKKRGSVDIDVIINK